MLKGDPRCRSWRGIFLEGCVTTAATPRQQIARGKLCGRSGGRVAVRATCRHDVKLSCGCPYQYCVAVALASLASTGRPESDGQVP